MRFTRYVGEKELDAPQDTTAFEFSESEKIVWDILERIPKARDSDKLLLLAYWQFECDANDIDHSNTPWTEFKKLLMSKDTYQPATIIRCRARIQEMGYFWGTNKEQRRSRAGSVRSYYAEKNEEEKNYEN
jgi:hypothetical protein